MSKTKFDWESCAFLLTSQERMGTPKSCGNVEWVWLSWLGFPPRISFRFSGLSFNRRLIITTQGWRWSSRYNPFKVCGIYQDSRPPSSCKHREFAPCKGNNLYISRRNRRSNLVRKLQNLKHIKIYWHDSRLSTPPSWQHSQIKQTSSLKSKFKTILDNKNVVKLIMKRFLRYFFPMPARP